MMKTRRYSPRQHLYVFMSLLVFLAMLLAACGGAKPSGGTLTPTPGKTAMPATQTSCPPEGTARAAVMVPLTLGKQNTVVYSEVQGSLENLTGVTLKRYTVSTRATTDIVTLPHNNIYEAQISADGQWVLLDARVSGTMVPWPNPAMLQLVRMDGQGLQTLYCGDFGAIQLSPDNKYVAFLDLTGQDQSKYTFKLLNIATGTIQTIPHNSNHAVYTPLAWLDNTHLYILGGFLTGNLYLLDISSGKIQQILDLSPPDQCFDVTHSIDGTQLFNRIASQCQLEGYTPSGNGPSSIQAQSATGGPAKTIYSTPTVTITALRVASSASLLLIIHNASTETNLNGLWKMNTDGTGLTRLISEAAFIKDAAYQGLGFVGLFGWTMDQPWANAPRDGTFYSIAVLDHLVPIRLLIGSMNGGAPVTIASGSMVAPVGWTTM